MKLNIALCKFLMNQSEEQILTIIDFLVYVKNHDINLAILFNNPYDSFKYKDIVQLILENKLKYEFYNNPLLTIKEYLLFLRNHKEKIGFIKELIDRLYCLNIKYLYYEKLNFINYEIKNQSEEKIFTDGKICETQSNPCKIKVSDYNWIIKYEKEIPIVPVLDIIPNRNWKSKKIYITNLDFDIDSLPTYEEVLNTDMSKAINVFDKLEEKILIK